MFSINGKRLFQWQAFLIFAFFEFILHGLLYFWSKKSNFPLEIWAYLLTPDKIYKLAHGKTFTQTINVTFYAFQGKGQGFWRKG